MAMSLWLVPHDGNPFTKSMKEFISDEVPKQFDQGKQSVGPHLTVTPDIDEKAFDGKSAQEWLDSIQFPEFHSEHNEVVLELHEFQADDDFYRKMNISVKDNANLQKLAAACKRASSSQDEEKAQKWAENDWQPCFPILSADIPTRDAANKIALIEMKLGFAIGDIFACCGGTLCMGGNLVLMDTSKSMDQWKPIAKRETPWVMWRASRGLI